MKYNIKEKVFTLADKFTVRDEHGEPILIVEGTPFSFTDKLRIYDMNMNELFYIEQTISPFIPDYRIYRDGLEVAHMKREFSMMHRVFIESDYGGYTIEGDIMHYNYTIRHDDIPVAEVKKKVFSFGDEYTLDIFVNENFEFLITMVIVIDQMFFDKNRHH